MKRIFTYIIWSSLALTAVLIGIAGYHGYALVSNLSVQNQETESAISDSSEAKVQSAQLSQQIDDQPSNTVASVRKQSTTPFEVVTVSSGANLDSATPPISADERPPHRVDDIQSILNNEIVSTGPSYPTSTTQPSQSAYGSLTNLDSQREVSDNYDSWAEIGGGIALLGRLETMDAHPVAAHTVNLYGTSARERIGSAETDSNGRFVFRNLESQEYLLQTQAHPFLTTAQRRVRAGGARQVIKVAYIDAVNVEGTITNNYGFPVAGATITPPMDEETVLSDEDGKFAFRTAATVGKGLRFRFSAPGYLPVAEYVSADNWHPSDMLELTPKLRKGVFGVPGIVVDQYGTPVRSALVQLNSKTENLHLTARTNQDGVFLLERVIMAADHKLTVTASAFFEPYVHRNISVSEGMAGLTIELQGLARGTLLGSITNTVGMRIPALALLVATEGEVGSVRTMQTDENGDFELENFIAGNVSIRSRSEPRISILDLEIKPGEVSQKNLIIDMGDLELIGQVQSEDGLTLSTAQIAMLSEFDEPGGYRSITSRARTGDSDGKFRFTGLSAGSRKVTIKAEGYTSVTHNLDPALEPGPHTFVLTRSAQP